jgi:hypothetical protein
VAAQHGGQLHNTGQGIAAFCLGFAEREHLDERGDLGALANASWEAIASETGEVQAPSKSTGEQREVSKALLLQPLSRCHGVTDLD